MQVYDPIMEGRLVKDGDVSGRRSHSRRQLGVAASFVVSGMVHELILRCAGRPTVQHCNVNAI